MRMSIRAEMKVDNHVMFGPSVTIISGDHGTEIIGRYMNIVNNPEKLPENDENIGSNVRF